MRLPKHANKEGEPLLNMGTNPQTPGIYRFPAGMFCRRAALPPNHASPCVGALVVSQRCHVFRSGSDSLPHVSLTGNLGSNTHCRNTLRHVITILFWLFPLAGFEVTTYGRL